MYSKTDARVCIVRLVRIADSIARSVQASKGTDERATAEALTGSMNGRNRLVCEHGVWAMGGSSSRRLFMCTDVLSDRLIATGWRWWRKRARKVGALLV